MDFDTDTHQSSDSYSDAGGADECGFGADASDDYSGADTDTDSESYDDGGEYGDEADTSDDGGDVDGEGYGDETGEGSGDSTDDGEGTADDQQFASNDGESGADGSAWDMSFKTGPGRFKENAALVEALWGGGYDIVHSAVSYGVHGAERAYDHYISGDAESEERHNQEMEQDKQEHYEGFRRIYEAL